MIKECSKVDFEKINQVFDAIIKDPTDSKIFESQGIPKQELVVLADRFRNQLFLEGVLQNNQCLISLAYDLDRFICDLDLNALVEVNDQIKEIVKSENLTCGANHHDADYNFYEKLKVVFFFHGNY